ncbi:MAG: hypothetical protein IH872_05010 [Chloroflexi bacterium]|nr:hypothetical protein [Chloroflexota bacterium]
MRIKETNQEISVHAIAGTHVVLLGLDATTDARKGLLGFTITRQEGDKKAFALSGGRVFKRDSELDWLKSDKAPIQAFLWGDYTVEPGTKYVYTVIPVYGSDDALKPGKSIAVTVSTEELHSGTHGVYFNRGVAGSQAYSRQFGEHARWYQIGENDWKEFIKPEDVPNREAYIWLSRGLEEAMLGFIGQATGPEFSLRASVYEFTYAPAIQAFVDALERNVDVKIIHHFKTNPLKRLVRLKASTVTVKGDDPATDKEYKKNTVLEERNPDDVTSAANHAVRQIGVKNEDHRLAYDRMMIKRTVPRMSHNKFIVLLKNGKPIQVWTGSTNYTDGGIFGQSNVGHIIRDEKIAQRYHDYWEKLSTNPPNITKENQKPGTGLRDWTVIEQPDLNGPPPPNSIIPVFSPRSSKAMLQWYADQIGTAKNSVFLTAAFTISDQFFGELEKNNKPADGSAYQRYVLLDGITGLLREKSKAIRQIPENSVAWGDKFKRRAGQEDEGELIESLTGLNDHVEYIHTKYMLIDPLGDHPVVISGSANFSSASTVTNDENMVVISGNKRIADIFLGEFMRMFSHFRARNEANALSDDEFEAARFLDTTDSWTAPYYKQGEHLQQERLLFR